MRSTSPARFARIGVGLGGFSGVRRLVFGVGGRKLWQVFVDEPVDQILHDGRVPRICPRVHRVFTAIVVTLEPLGFLPGGDHRPAGPRADRHAPLSPGGTVDQDEPLTARQEDAEAKARAILVKHHVFPGADFGSLYKPFRQMRGHPGSPCRTD